jgi:hypothetical protein
MSFCSWTIDQLLDGPTMHVCKEDATAGPIAKKENLISIRRQ